MKLYLLGAGVPTPTPERFGTCYVLQVGQSYLMFDCGPAATYKLVKAGLFPTQIDHLFFTHHHFDHNADYPCFLLCRWDQSIGKENVLHVWGPPPTAWITERLIGPEGAFSHDWKARVGAPVSQSVFVNRGGVLPRPAPRVHVKDVGPGMVAAHSDWTVSAATAVHVQPWLDSLAYRVDTGEGSIVFAGDTGWCDSVIRLARQADTLVAKCWDHQEAMEQNGEAAGQTGTWDAGKMAQECGVKRLILSHSTPRLARPASKEKGIADVARLYDGQIIFAEEMMVLEL